MASKKLYLIVEVEADDDVSVAVLRNALEAILPKETRWHPLTKEPGSRRPCGKIKWKKTRFHPALGALKEVV